MNCPKCQTVMREREKEDVILDICPSCRGVWLDAGELEKLVAVEQSVYERRGWRYDDDDDDDDYARGRGYSEGPGGRPADYDQRGQRPRKKKSFLSNIFESFGEGGSD